MSENIYLNYLNAKERPFKEFTVIARSATIIQPIKDNIKKMYELLMQLSSMKIADVDFKRNTLFIKGNDDKVAELLNEKKIASVSKVQSTVRLEINKDANIVRALFYRAFSRYASKKGFQMLLDRKVKWKRLLPLNMSLEELVKEELAIKIKDEFILYHGLYVMLEIFNDGGALLWVDLYSPIIRLSDRRPLNPREIKQLGFRDVYTSLIPKPIKRLELTNNLLKILCSNSMLEITFADEYSVTFDCNFPLLKVKE